MANNDEEFATLYEKYNRRVVTYIVSFGYTREEARDLAQETFIRVYRNMEQYRREARWAFLKKAARNVTLNHIRDKAAKKRDGKLAPANDEDLANVTDHHLSPEDAAVLNEILGRALEAIEKLSANDRECMHLHLMGHKYREIAQVLNISEGTVKSRIHEARKRLKEQGIELPWPNNQSGTPSTDD